MQADQQYTQNQQQTQNSVNPQPAQAPTTTLGLSAFSEQSQQSLPPGQLPFTSQQPIPQNSSLSTLSPLPPAVVGDALQAAAQLGTILSAGVASQGQNIAPQQPGMGNFMPHIPPNMPAVSKRSQRQQKGSKTKILPPELDIEGPSSNEAYKVAMADKNLTIYPKALNFLPSNYWVDQESPFGELVTKFFQRKNNANCRFPHKLYNALSVVEQDPTMYNLLGVKWVTDEIFKVDKLIFGRLLGISSIDGGLFHRQGNFPSHGFTELSSAQVNELKVSLGDEIADVDQERIRLMFHEGKMFSKMSDEDSVTKCKWANSDKVGQ